MWFDLVTRCAALNWSVDPLKRLLISKPVAWTFARGHVKNRAGFADDEHPSLGSGQVLYISSNSLRRFYALSCVRWGLPSNKIDSASFFFFNQSALIRLPLTSLLFPVKMEQNQSCDQTFIGWPAFCKLQWVLPLLRSFENW